MRPCGPVTSRICPNCCELKARSASCLEILIPANPRSLQHSPRPGANLRCRGSCGWPVNSRSTGGCGAASTKRWLFCHRYTTVLRKVSIPPTCGPPHCCWKTSVAAARGPQSLNTHKATSDESRSLSVCDVGDRLERADKVQRLLSGGGLNRSTQHPFTPVRHVGMACICRDMHGHGSCRS